MRIPLLGSPGILRKRLRCSGMSKRIGIGRWLRRQERNHPFLRRYIRAFFRLSLSIRFRAETFHIRTDPRTILFASFEGTSFSDNPRALYEYMIRSGKFADYTFVWGFRERTDVLRLQLEKDRNRLLAESGLSDGPGIQVVQYDTRSWRRSLARAGYWIINYEPPDEMTPKADQIVLQTWHGTPFKRIGYDLEHLDNDFRSLKELQAFYGREIRKFHYFLSPSPFASERFRSAWRMEDCGKAGIILESGYPRNDILFHASSGDIDRIRRKIFGGGNLPCGDLLRGKTVVLYAPTYRQGQHASGAAPWQPELDFDRLQRDLGENVIFLIRAHYFVTEQLDFSKYAGFLFDVSGPDDISELYLISDILVTDYSSAMFDYANLRRPMIFYMYDLEHYREKSNGFYFDPEEELPGPIVRTQEELTDAIRSAGNAADDKYEEKYRRFLEKFDPLDDGRACERVTAAVFGA